MGQYLKKLAEQKVETFAKVLFVSIFELQMTVLLGPIILREIKKSMIKYLQSTLSLLALLSLLACNSKVNTTDASSASSETTAEAAPKGIQDVDVTAFKAKMQEENVVLLDVRTPAEVAAGKIEGALEINVLGDDFEQKIQNLEKDKTYLVYCKAGSRSARACKVMEKSGFTDLYNLKGGYTAWSAQ